MGQQQKNRSGNLFSVSSFYTGQKLVDTTGQVQNLKRLEKTETLAVKNPLRKSQKIKNHAENPKPKKPNEFE